MSNEICGCCQKPKTTFPSGQKSCDGAECNAEGDYVIRSSDEWVTWRNGSWVPMTAEEQIQASK